MVETTPQGRIGLPATPHPPQLYARSSPAVVAFGTGLNAVTLDAAALYRDVGYLVIDDGYDARSVSAAGDALDDLCCGRNASFAAATAAFNPDVHRGNLYGPDVALKTAAHRVEILQYEAMASELGVSPTPSALGEHVRKMQGITTHDARLEAVAFAPALIDAVRTLLGGSEEEEEEVYLLQDMALVKGPGGREKPWHQDQAYFDLHNTVPVCGIWIAIDEATAANGCMYLLAREHRQHQEKETAGAARARARARAPKPASHFQVRDWQICDSDALLLGSDCGVPAAHCATLRPGGVLFFDGLCPHGTPTNESCRRRRALQFHFVLKAQLRWCEPGERLADFSGAQRGATC